jgi:hypothetical protein
MAGCSASVLDMEVVPQRWAPTMRKLGSIRAGLVGRRVATKTRRAACLPAAFRAVRS